MAKSDQASLQAWLTANQRYLATEVQKLRLLLQRRVLWLRHNWQSDSQPGYHGMIITEAQADWLLSEEDRLAEMQFYAKNRQALETTAAIGAIQEDLTKQQQAFTDEGTQPTLATLVRLFSLTPFERHLILVCLALALDSGFERLYAYAQDDISRKYATGQLALDLYPAWKPHESPSLPDSLSPDAPLRRFQLVRLDAGAVPGLPLAARPLILQSRVADYIRGHNRPEPMVKDLLVPLPPLPVAPQHRKLIDDAAALYASNKDGRPWPLLNLVGPDGVGKAAVARGVCHRLGRHPFKLHLQRLPAPGGERQDTLRILERELFLQPMGLYLDASRLDPNDAAARDALDDLFMQLNGVLILASPVRWDRVPGMVDLPLPKPDAADRLAMWRQALERFPHTLNGHLDGIVQQFDFGPQAMEEIVNAARARVSMRGKGVNEPLGIDDLWQACRQKAGLQLDTLAQRIRPCYHWQDIVLPEDVRIQLKEIAAQVKHRHQVYETWGFGAKLSRGRGISALFAGPSGTGKTMAAEILANHLDLDLYRIDLAGVVSKYIGETEKNLKKMFDVAEQSGAILFFDEADALFGKRTEVKDSHDRYANIEVNYLLQRMEDYQGLAILATNRKAALDRAFLRRLRFLVDFPFPDKEQRRKIWQNVFPPRAALDPLDLNLLQRLQISGGNIRTIALNAAFLAAEADRPIGMAGIMRAARREYAKIGKLISENEFGRYYATGSPGSRGKAS